MRYTSSHPRAFHNRITKISSGSSSRPRWLRSCCCRPTAAGPAKERHHIHRSYWLHRQLDGPSPCRADDNDGVGSWIVTFITPRM